ncbi:MAG: hypothetical protein COB53_03910 [Elusimicrobia bacterium]|nr:MAG: hypothetical protein COB53_03910 [Elusimicrobiota bacterium]
MIKDNLGRKSISILIAIVFVVVQPGSAFARFTAVTGKTAVQINNAAAPTALTPGVSNALQLSVPAASLSLNTSLPILSAPIFAAPKTVNAASAQERRVTTNAKAAPASTGLRFVTDGGNTVGRAAPLPINTNAAVPESVEPASAENTRSPLARLGLALQQRSFTPLFDGSRSARQGRGMGMREAEPEDAGIPLDEQPRQPGETEVARVSWKRVSVPGARASGLRNLFRSRSDDVTQLSGAPQTAAAVESELRRLIDADPARFGGVPSSTLETTISKRIQGRAGLADIVDVEFRQTYHGAVVEGTFLHFTVRIGAAQSNVISETAQLYPNLTVNTDSTLDDAQALESAFERLGRPTGSYNDLQPVGRKVMHIGGHWRYVSVHYSDSKALLAAVDLNTGDAFAWDPKVHAESRGKLIGRGVHFDPPATGTNIVDLAMPHAEVKTSDGRTLFTDADGWFTLEGDQPVTITATLKGKYATIKDQGTATLTITATVTPGKPIRLVFNPEGFDENTVAQVNAYRHANVVHDWLARNQIEDEIKRSIPIKTNINRDCNAFYTPWSPSLNFFKSSGRCINTAFDTVVYHEYGHFVDDMIGGIANSALSEGWGDIIGMYITGQPVLGEGFLKDRTPNYIRHGENKYQFQSRDEVHKQGQAWMGFGWKLRKALIAKLGDVEGTAVAEALVVPVLFANVRSIPAAIEAVVMRAIGDNGQIEHFEEIRAAAAAHGIVVERPVDGSVGALARQRGFIPWLSTFVGERRI